MSECPADPAKDRLSSLDIFKLADELQIKANGSEMRASAAPDEGARELYSASALAYGTWAVEIQRIAQDIARIERSAQAAQQYLIIDGADSSERE